MVDGKARLVSDVYCDGLGACIGECPTGAITIEQREAAEFDPKAVERRLSATRTAPSFPATSPHGHGHGGFACPGSAARTLVVTGGPPRSPGPAGVPVLSRLGNWPVQLHLVPLSAPYLRGARLLISADCVPFALPGFHNELLDGRVLLVGCPKLDDTDAYVEKMTAIFQGNDIRSVDVAYMEVPCCHSLVQVVRQALSASGRAIPLSLVQVSIQGVIRERVEAPPRAEGSTYV
jgi:ferredoxin